MKQRGLEDGRLEDAAQLVLGHRGHGAGAPASPHTGAYTGHTQRGLGVTSPGVPVGLLEIEQGEVTRHLVAEDHLVLPLHQLVLARGVKRKLLITLAFDGKSLCHYLQTPGRQLFLLKTLNLSLVIKFQAVGVISHSKIQLS